MEFIFLVTIVLVIIFTYNTYIFPKLLYGKIENLVDKHISVLAEKRKKFVHRGEYDEIIFKKYEKEINYFMVKIILPVLSKREIAYISRNNLSGFIANKVVDKRVRNYIQNSESE